MVAETCEIWLVIEENGEKNDGEYDAHNELMM